MHVYVPAGVEAFKASLSFFSLAALRRVTVVSLGSEVYPASSHFRPTTDPDQSEDEALCRGSLPHPALSSPRQHVGVAPSVLGRINQPQPLHIGFKALGAG